VKPIGGRYELAPTVLVALAPLAASAELAAEVAREAFALEAATRRATALDGAPSCPPARVTCEDAYMRVTLCRAHLEARVARQAQPEVLEPRPQRPLRCVVPCVFPHTRYICSAATS
jgi:hypothetical protein